MSKTNGGPILGDRLRSFIERVEKLIEERTSLNGDIRDVFSEAKGVGYDVRTMRKVVQLRAMDVADRAEQESLLEVYLHALEQVDRIDARLAAGQSQREVASAENVSKSTVQRRGPKAKAAPTTSEMDHIDDGRTHGDSAAVAGSDSFAPAAPAHDPETGVIAENMEAEPQGRAGAPSEPSSPAAQSAELTRPPPAGVSGGAFPGKGSVPASFDEVQEVGAGEPRPEGTPPDDLTTPPFLKRTRDQVPA